MKVFWSNFAKSELKNIYLYHKDVAGINIAKKLKSRILKVTSQLKNYPGSGQIELILSNNKSDYRYIIAGNYKIIYKQIKEGILITDVFDSRQNPVKMNQTKR